MATRTVTDGELTGVADHIRAKSGKAGELVWPTGFASAIDALPDPLSAADAGKVVVPDGDGGYELTAQETATFDSNGTRDTTRIGSVTVENCYEPFTTAAEFEAIIKNGNGPKRFPEHSRILIPYGGTLWPAEVVSHNTAVDLDDPAAPTCTLLWLNGLPGKAFGDAQKYAHIGAGLATGQYNFKGIDGNRRSCTVRAAVPAGGYIVFDDESHISTYDATGTQLESDYCSILTVGTALASVAGVLLNGTEAEGYNRVTNGSGNYVESALRQWLNADAAGWWTAKTPFDFQPYYSAEAGFLAQLDPAWAAILKRTEQITARNTIFEANGTVGGYATTTDRVFLPSITELGIGQNNGIAEGTVWSGFTGAASRGMLDRARTDSAQAVMAYWWTRSAVTGNTYQAQDGLQAPSLPSAYAGKDKVPRICPAFVV